MFAYLDEIKAQNGLENLQIVNICVIIGTQAYTKYSLVEKEGVTMKYKILHYISVFNIVALVYLLVMYVALTFFGQNYTTLITTTIIFILLIKFKILTFGSSWLDRK